MLEEPQKARSVYIRLKTENVFVEMLSLLTSYSSLTMRGGRASSTETSPVVSARRRNGKDDPTYTILPERQLTADQEQAYKALELHDLEKICANIGKEA
jgi:hypothetical protein